MHTFAYSSYRPSTSGLKGPAISSSSFLAHTASSDPDPSLPGYPY